MFSFSAIPPDLNTRRPEAIRLEPEQFEQALVNPLASPSVDEAGQWQLYLNALALLGFEQWLEKRAPSHCLDRTQCINHIGAVYNLKIDEFKLNLIVKEQVLDEVVEIPREALEQPALVAHFYVLLEVCEEQQRLMIRGFLRSDRLINYCHRVSDSLQNGYYQIPLSVFDPEPNHLLFYCDFLEPASIPLPVISTEHTATPDAISETTLTASQETPIQLGQWIQGVFAAGWQAIDDLFSPEVHLAWSPRNQREGAKRGKLIDLGMELQGQRVVLLVNVTEEADNQLSVLVQLHPAGEERYLPPQIALTLLSQAGKKLQEVGSRTQDNYIQLKSFKGRSGIPFSIVVSLGDTCLCENFELQALGCYGRFLHRQNYLTGDRIYSVIERAKLSFYPQERSMTAIAIDDSGKLEIPLEIRQQLGITTAQSLNLEVRQGCIILQPLEQEAKVQRQGSALVLETPPLGHLDTLIDDLREERIQSQLPA